MKVMFMMTVLYCATLADKNCNYDSSDVLKYLTKADNTALASVISRLLCYTA